MIGEKLWQPSRQPWLLLAITTLLFLPHFFNMGFYGDDWSTLLIQQRHGWQAYAVQFFAGSIDRPLLSLYYAILIPICGERAWAWQVALALLTWLAACALHRLLRALLTATDDIPSSPANRAAFGATIGWLVTPWSLAITAWPSAGYALGSLAFWCVAMTRLTRPDAHTWRAGLVAGLWLLASMHTYEAFLPQWVPMLVLLAILRRRTIAGIPYWRAAVVMAIISMWVLLWGRLAFPLLMGEHALKTFNPRWVYFSAVNIVNFPSQMCVPLGHWCWPAGAAGLLMVGIAARAAWRPLPGRRWGVWPAAVGGLLVLLTLLAIGATTTGLCGHSLARASVILLIVLWLGYFLGLALVTPSAPYRQLAAAMGAAAGGTILSLVMYGCAKYYFGGSGPSARQALAPVVWLVIFAAMAWAMTQQQPGWRKRVGQVVGLVLIFALTMGAFKEAHYWTTAWRFGRQLVQQIDGAALAPLPRGSVVLCVGNIRENGVVAFADAETLAYAMAYTWPSIYERDIRVVSPFSGSTLYKPTISRWDGRLFTQHGPDGLVCSWRSKHFYTWDPRTRTVTSQVAPFSFDSDSLPRD